MMQNVINSYVQGVPFSDQTDCIEAFFDNDFWMKQLGFPEDTGSDKETSEKIVYMLANRDVYSIPPHIIEMLESWNEDGF
jgi:hypothetical protein